MEEHSPIIKTDDHPAQMTFYQALKLAAEGKKIHKLEWKDKGNFGFFKDERLMLQKPDGTLNTWIIRDADVLGEDWIIV